MQGANGDYWTDQLRRDRYERAIRKDSKRNKANKWVKKNILSPVLFL